MNACHQTDGGPGWDRCTPEGERGAMTAPGALAALLPDRPILDAPAYAAPAPISVEALHAPRSPRPPEPPPRPLA